MQQKIGEESDRDLWQRLVHGGRDAFHMIYRKHNGAMVRVASSILGNRSSAEEVAQETWITVLESISSFEGRSSLAAWIFAILVNKARTRAARDGRVVSLDSGEECEGGAGSPEAAYFDERGAWREPPALWHDVTPERIINGQQLVVHVREAIEALPPLQRSVIVLRAQQELEPEEVCQILGLTSGNMRILLHRARMKLRAAVDGLVK